MAMRNFYITADIDGRATTLAGGPARKDGGMSIDIRQRDEGSSVTAFRIICYEKDGELTTRVFNNQGSFVTEFTTKR